MRRRHGRLARHASAAVNEVSGGAPGASARRPRTQRRAAASEAGAGGRTAEGRSAVPSHPKRTAPRCQSSVQSMSQSEQDRTPIDAGRSVDTRT